MDLISYPKEINYFFSKVVSKIKNTINPQFILIAGSFGKKSWLYSDDKLISDFEFVFICNKRWSLKEKKKLLIELNNDFDYDISLKGYLLDKVYNKIISNYSNKPFNYIDLNFFDTFSNPVILYSKSKKDLNIAISCSEIPAWEAWRLYVNRMGDLLSLAIKEQSVIQENYFWLKIFESTADAYLILNNSYSKNIDKRIAVFTKELLESDIELHEGCVNSYKWIHESLNSRKNHDLSLFDISKLNNKERRDIVNEWMTYFVKKMSKESSLDSKNFSQNYCQSKSLQNKYLEIENHFAIQLSNLLRGITKYRTLKLLNISFLKMGVSWRHMSLLAVSEFFREEASNTDNFKNTKQILKQIMPVKIVNKLSNKELLEVVHGLWKQLR